MVAQSALRRYRSQPQGVPIGGTGTGFGVDIPFEGTATSSHWEGERTVAGVDIVRIGADGVQALEIRVRIGEGADAVAFGRMDGNKLSLTVSLISA